MSIILNNPLINKLSELIAKGLFSDTKKEILYAFVFNEQKNSYEKIKISLEKKGIYAK